MSTRAKLVCTEIVPNMNGEEKNYESVKFQSRYNTEDSPEDNSFSRWTPSADFSMCLSNPDLYGKFEVGKAYYFDISEA